MNDKKIVTLVSMIAAALLACGKLVVGLATGSLGLLSEAAHSCLDFIASVVTFFAVRVSDKPADHEHTYGHGKVENLSALLESVLLLVACGWIVYEAVRRIFYHRFEVEANALAFGMMIISIVVDFWRSAALRRAARKYKSQALEADALNFTTDMVTSSVVLVGLCFVKYGQYTGQMERFESADSVAALVVTVLLMSVTVRLAKRAVDVLMDRAPHGIQMAVEKAARGVEGVTGVHQIRVRPSGNRTFIDLHVCVARNIGLEPSHRIAESVESTVQSAIEYSDVIVHVDPRPVEEEKLAERVRVVAANHGAPVHSLRFSRQDGKLHLELDLEVETGLSLEQAHAISKRLEQSLREEIPEIYHVHTHIEPRRLDVEPTSSVGPESQLVRDVRERVRAMPGVMDCHAVEIERVGRGEADAAQPFVVSLHCTFAENARIEEVHKAAEGVEAALKAKYPSFRRVHVHTEPGKRRAGTS